MKFLVLALCVCAASAATFGQKPYGGSPPAYKPFQGFKNAPGAPVVTAAKAVASVAAPAAAVAASPFVAAGAAAYEAGSATYQAAKQVVNKASSNEGEAAVLRSESEVTGEGYRYGYETANGISADATGSYRQVGEAGAVVSQGSYRYISPDGTPVEVVYIADENGYQPQSASLPVGPAIPEAIARSLIYIAEKTKNEVQKY